MCLEGLGRVRARRVACAAEEERERSRRADCAVCLTAPRAVAFGPCGHIACCKGCAPTLDVCPLCKKDVASRLPVFLP